MNNETSTAAQPERKTSGARIFLIVLVTVLVTAGLTLWVAKVYLFPSAFKPVELSVKEEQVLDAKLKRLERGSAETTRRPPLPGSTSVEQLPEVLEPEAYSEAGANRTVTLSERELNALLAKNTDLARKLAIDLSDDLVSAKLLVPVDEDFPILGGRILKVRAGLELAYRDTRPVVVLRGVSVMGVPVPNAWLGNLKNIDLVEQYGTGTGFWSSFADGVEYISVVEGNLKIQLKE